MHELFEEQAAATPDAVALVEPDRSLTYRELNSRANRLARHLVARGVGTGSRVGLRMPRSVEAVTTMLAVLKAGAAYVPLEAEQPSERLRLMAEENRLGLVLTAGGLEWTVTGAQVLGWDEVAEVTADLPDGDLGADVHPDDVAYVPYTSGSTGLPKGIEVPHRAVTGFFWGEDYTRWGPDAVSLHHLSMSWDGHVLDIYPPLLTGARVVVFTGDARDPVSVARFAAANGVTVLWLTAAAFNTVVDVDVRVLKGLRYLLVGGETVSAAHVARAVTALPDTRIVNGYGPCECTAFCCVHPISPADTAAASIPIGRPVGDRRVHLLDAGGAEVAAGETGEVHVGGPGVALGYLARPALTAERFVPEQFGPGPGARLYRTGDLARRGGGGRLEFVGRVDDQVKIRGFRVEPGEVAEVLRTHAGVRDAGVVARFDAIHNSHELVAYVVPAADPVPPAVLRAFLAGRLPAAMVPAAVVTVPRLPLTRNGKLDREALPEPQPADRAAEVTAAAPLGETEEFLAATWTELLGVTPGRDDDFFEIGGHSLVATQLVSRIRRRFGVQMPLHVVYQEPTLAGLAAEVDRAIQAAGPAAARPEGVPAIPRAARQRRAADNSP